MRKGYAEVVRAKMLQGESDDLTRAQVLLVRMMEQGSKTRADTEWSKGYSVGYQHGKVS